MWCEWVMSAVDQWAAWQRSLGKDPWIERTINEEIWKDRCDKETANGIRRVAQLRKQEAEMREAEEWSDYIHALRQRNKEKYRG